MQAETQAIENQLGKLTTRPPTTESLITSPPWACACKSCRRRRRRLSICGRLANSARTPGAGNGKWKFARASGNTEIGLDTWPARSDYDQLEQQQQHQRHQHHARTHDNQAPHQLQQQAGPQPLAATNTFVVLYDYVAQRGDEIQMSAGQLVQLLDTSERDWWKVAALDGTNRIGYFPSSYLAQLYQNERPLQVAQTIQVSNGETCDKLLRGQVGLLLIRLLSNQMSSIDRERLYALLPLNSLTSRLMPLPNSSPPLPDPRADCHPHWQANGQFCDH